MEVRKNKITSYKDLEIWQLAAKLIVKVYKIVETFPTEEKFGISAQAKDSVVSVAANIAESYGRFYYKDKIKFIYNSRGSLLETESHLRVANEVGFITERNQSLYQGILREITLLGIKINNYLTSLWNETKNN